MKNRINSADGIKASNICILTLGSLLSIFLSLLLLFAIDAITAENLLRFISIRWIEIRNGVAEYWWVIIAFFIAHFLSCYGTVARWAKVYDSDMYQITYRDTLYWMNFANVALILLTSLWILIGTLSKMISELEFLIKVEFVLLSICIVVSLMHWITITNRKRKTKGEQDAYM